MPVYRITDNTKQHLWLVPLEVDHVILRIDTVNLPIDDMCVYTRCQRTRLIFFAFFSSVLLAYRIWHVGRKAKSNCGRRQSRMRPVLQIILDAGMIYSFTLVAALLCLVTQTNGQAIILNMVSHVRSQ